MTSRNPFRPPLLARSISRPVQQELEAGPVAGRVVGAFERACNLVTDEGRVIAVVLPQIGDGPLNIVVDAPSGAFAAVEPGMLVRTSGTRLWVGEVAVELAGAVRWEPCPDWQRLRLQSGAIARRLSVLQALALEEAPAGTLLAAMSPAPPQHNPMGGALQKAACDRVRLAAGELRAGWQGNQNLLRSGATRLAGVGNGLTPAGDDFLVGLLLWAWLAHSAPLRFCGVVADCAAPRTSALSAALLRAAADGQCNAPWHQLLDALSVGDDRQWVGAVQAVLAQGATSGGDALAGFLWLGSTQGEPA